MNAIETMKHLLDRAKAETEPQDRLISINVPVEVVEEIIDALPSEDPEPKWTLCSERSPENSGYYIVTNNCEKLDYHWYSTMYGWQYYKSPIAWMPLPECYRGEQDDEQRNGELAD